MSVASPRSAMSVASPRRPRRSRRSSGGSTGSPASLAVSTTELNANSTELNPKWRNSDSSYSSSSPPSSPIPFAPCNTPACNTPLGGPGEQSPSRHKLGSFQFRAASSEFLLDPAHDVGRLGQGQIDFENIDISGWRPRPVRCNSCGELVRPGPTMRRRHEEVCGGHPIAAIPEESKDDIPELATQKSPTMTELKAKLMERGVQTSGIYDKQELKARLETSGVCGELDLRPLPECALSWNDPANLTSSERMMMGKIDVPDRLRLLDTVGTGAFGVVRLCRVLNLDRPFCVKTMSKDLLLRLSKGNERKMSECVLSEKRIFEQVNHPFIVKLHKTFQSENTLYMVMEYVPGGEVRRHLMKAKRFRTSAARFYAAQVVLVFEYLHSQRIAYRDLKTENLLVAANGYLKVVDFGFAKHIPEGHKTFTLIGTNEYLAPEIIKSKTGHGLEVDWWALGILVYEMLIGHTPFCHSNFDSMYTQVLSGQVPFPRPFEVDVTPKHSQQGKKIVSEFEEPDFIRQLLTAHPDQRLGSKGAWDVKQHRFFNTLDWEAVENGERPAPFVPQLQSDWDSSMFKKYTDADCRIPTPGPISREQQSLFTGY